MMRLKAFLNFPTNKLWVHMVEAGGVEPPSESISTGTSPGADGYLHSLTLP